MAESAAVELREIATQPALSAEDAAWLKAKADEAEAANAAASAALAAAAAEPSAEQAQYILERRPSMRHPSVSRSSFRSLALWSLGQLYLPLGNPNYALSSG